MPELARRVLAKLERERREREVGQGQASPSTERARIPASVFCDPDQAVQDPIFGYLGMSLDTFEQEGALLELAVPWLDTNLWFVPGEQDAAALAMEGVNRGRVWTAKELLDLLAIPGLPKEQVQTIARAKMIFEGTVSA